MNISILPRWLLVVAMGGNAASAWALEADAVRGTWKVSGREAFGQAIDPSAPLTLVAGVDDAALVWTLASEDGAPVKLVVGNWVSVSPVAARVEVQRIGDPAVKDTYQVEMPGPNRLKLTQKTGALAGQVLALSIESTAKRASGAAAEAGRAPTPVPAPVNRSTTQKLDLEEAKRQHSHLKSLYAGEWEKLKAAKESLDRQLRLSGALQDGRQAEFLAIVKERKADVEQHRDNLLRIGRKIKALEDEYFDVPPGKSAAP